MPPQTPQLDPQMLTGLRPSPPRRAAGGWVGAEGSGRSGAVTRCVPVWTARGAVGGLAACPTGARYDVTAHGYRCAVPACGVRDRVHRSDVSQRVRAPIAAHRPGGGVPDAAPGPAD